MRSSFVAVLVAVVCVEQVRSLWCFKCDKEPSNFNCLGRAKCAETDKYCLTTVQILGPSNESSYQLSKGCSATCPDNAMDRKPGSPSTDCCNTFLCNFSGATSVKTSVAVMALGILASFFYIFRSGL